VIWLAPFNGYQHRLARCNGSPHRLALNSHSPQRPARLSHFPHRPARLRDFPHRPARLGDFPHRLARLTLLPCLSSEKSQNLLSSTDFRQLAVTRGFSRDSISLLLPSPRRNTDYKYCYY
jgi:hypothetical protein